MDSDALAAVVSFLREWLPDSAIGTYRAMIEHDPQHWHRHPHFGEGIVVKRFLRGNGITEQVLGVDDLNEVWPEVLRRVVVETPPSSG